MKPHGLALLLWLLEFSTGWTAPLFQDDFREAIGPGWRWLRETPEAWRVNADGLQLRVLPGNMWGGANDARNVLLRPAPTNRPLEITVEVEHQPTEQYEQVDLVWYYDDGHMVKIGAELVDHQLSIVMGREEADRTRTLAIIPWTSPRVELRLLIEGDQISGWFRAPGAEAWRRAGACSLPGTAAPHISLQAYQGTSRQEHWARITRLRVQTGPALVKPADPE